MSLQPRSTEEQILMSCKEEPQQYANEFQDDKQNDAMLVEEQVTLASLLPRKERKGIENEPFNAKLKNQYQSQSTDNLYPYYCGLCGTLCLATNFQLEKMPSRNTDGALKLLMKYYYYSICLNYKHYYLKLYLSKGEEKYIKRKQGIEHQWRYNCECGVQIAYASIPFELFEKQLALSQEKQLQEEQPNKKYIFYILNDSLVIATKHSMLFKELSKTKYII